MYLGIQEIQKPVLYCNQRVLGNPRRLYIVMRCEEHSDYVEKVFVDKDKAIAYCEKYNSNPREYSRTIEEMEVTL